MEMDNGLKSLNTDNGLQKAVAKHIQIKEDVDTEFDAYTDGTTVHKKYRLRGPKTVKIENNSKVIEEEADTFACQKCSKTFTSKTGLLNHMRMHQVIRKFTCALCETVFNTNSELIKHKSSHRGEDRIFLCKTCKEAFTNHCDFLIHEISHTKRSYYKCIECGVYKNPSTIKNHLKSHYEYQLECNVCNKKFLCSSSLNSHIKNHDEPTIECEECGKLLKTQRQYKEHLAVHIGVKKLQCLYCGQGFFTRTAVTVHTRKHTNERPYECDVCNKSFYQETDMRRHKNTHELAKSYECNVCSKTYRHLESLKQHTKLHTNKNLYHCPECNKPCQNKQCLRAHLIYKHSDKRDYKCRICDTAFKARAQMERHFLSKAHQRAAFATENGD